MDITWSVFPKFYSHLSIEQLADLIHHVGLDTTNVVIRDGFWVTKANIRQELPAFVKRMDALGLKIAFSTAGFMLEDVLADDTPLAALAECGVKQFRMGYFKWNKGQSPAESMDDGRRQMAQLAELCARHDLRAVYQVHHGTLIHNAWAAWQLVHDLPAENVGVMLDPGNQVNEGWDHWMTAVHLMGPHLAAMGIKDGGVYRDGDLTGEKKGWYARLGVTLQEGRVNWYDVARALKSVHFAGTFVFMPFYDKDGIDVMTAKLKAEVSYLRDVIATVEKEA